MTADGPDGVTTGELSRGLSRVEREMQAGFDAVRKEIRALTFVPAAVYASDMIGQRERVDRLEQDLAEERRERQAAQHTGDQRAWQAKLAVGMAAAGIPISIVTAVATAALK